MNKIEIKTNEQGDIFVSARDLYKHIGIKTRFSKWIKQYIEDSNRYGFKMGVDFIDMTHSTLVNNGATRELKNYGINKNVIVTILYRSNTLENCEEIEEILESLGIEKDTIINSTRFELSFLRCLEETLKPIGISFEYQKNILSYRTDFYFPKHNILFEYDESYHNTKRQTDKDAKRENDIIKEIGCEIVRLDYRNTDNYNVGVVISKLFNIS